MSQSQSCRALTHEGYVRVERGMAKGIKQRAGHQHLSTDHFRVALNGELYPLFTVHRPPFTQ
eukprot:365509-Chlamydomonas_euryale.AAC.33